MRFGHQYVITRWKSPSIIRRRVDAFEMCCCGLGGLRSLQVRRLIRAAFALQNYIRQIPICRPMFKHNLPRGLDCLIRRKNVCCSSRQCVVGSSLAVIKNLEITTTVRVNLSSLIFFLGCGVVGVYFNRFTYTYIYICIFSFFLESQGILCFAH